MSFFLALILCGLAVVLHEVGHFVAMRKAGVEVYDIGFGYPVSGWRALSLAFRKAKLRIYLHPLFFWGAYVKPTALGGQFMANLPWHTRIYIMGAGLVANFLFSLSLSLVALYISHDLSGKVFCWCVLLMLLISLFPEKFSVVLFPLIGWAVLAFLIWGWGRDPLGYANAPGMAIIVRFFSPSSFTIVRALWVGALFALGGGVVNCLPFAPLDGGAITVMWLERLKLTRVAAAWGRVSAYLLILLSLWAWVHNTLCYFH